MLRSLMRFCVAGFLAVIVTTLLLLLMRAMLGGFANPDENFFTRLFALNTVTLPADPGRPFKPAPVQERPDLPHIEGLDLMDNEPFPGSQPLPDAVTPDVYINVDNPVAIPSVTDENRVTGSDLENRRKEIISILESDPE